MIDWTRLIGFDWDDGNSRKNADKHRVSQAESEQSFYNQPLLTLLNPKHSRQEPRYHALGRTDDNRLLHVTFTLRGNEQLIRVISARDMHRKERAFYEQAKDDS